MKVSQNMRVFLGLILCVGFLAFVVVPNFIREPNTSPRNACINNLRRIDTAIQQWAIENHKTNSDIPTWKEITPYLGQDMPEVPKCPLGGTYTLGQVDVPPTCSIPGHELR